jgi:predicted esterase
VSDDRPSSPHAHHLRVERTARYFTLGDASAPRAIWFVLHGYGQLAGEFVRYFSDLADDDALVVAPEALNRFYLVSPEKSPARERPVGATRMTREDRASEIADYVEYLDALDAEVASTHATTGARINDIGFSQGAATATRWLTHGRSSIHRLILWGGLMPPETDLSRGQGTLRGASLAIVVGDRDHYVTDELLAAERARLAGAHIAFDEIRFVGGHVISRGVFPQLREPAEPSAASGR